MATVKFLLRNNKTDKPVSVNFDICLSATNRLRGSTNIKISPQFWDSGKQQIRNKVEVYDIKDDLNTKLSNFRSFVLKKLSKYEITNVDEIQHQLKEDIDIYLGKKVIEIEETVTFHTFVKKFIKQSESRIIEHTGKKLSVRTTQDYTRTHELLKDFEKKKNFPVSFETINLDFYYAFKNYLEKLEFSVNTIGKFIKIIKVFLNAATEQGLNSNLGYKNKRFVKPNAKSDHIYLNINELNKIIALDLSDDPALDNARDLFIISSFTGLRVSDFNELTKENIKTFKGKRFFQVNVNKTDKYLPIPVHPEIEKILKKYNGSPPPKMRAQLINDALLIIGEKAKINELISISKIKGGKKTTELTPKYKLIKNHTARRSFCTNAYISGMHTLDIMAISGHSSEKTLRGYIKITADERAFKIADSPFFKPKQKASVKL